MTARKREDSILTNLNDVKYEVTENNGLWIVSEDSYALYQTDDKNQAYGMMFKLKQGSGFEGNTPTFMGLTKWA